MAIGIGLNTAVFSVVHGVLWRPLSFPDSDRLALIVDRAFDSPGDGTSIPSGRFVDVQRQSRSFATMAASNGRPIVITEGGNPELVLGLQ